jgi:hypothetical protein
MSSTRQEKPFSVEVTTRVARFTFYDRVPGAEYLAPAKQFTIPIKNWRALVANGGPEADTITYCNFTDSQLAAYGIQNQKPE